MIRLTSLELRNFKNIGEGNIVLSSWSTKRSLPGSDIIGIYGQNGSGKTSVIQALAVLKNIFYGGAAWYANMPGNGVSTPAVSVSWEHPQADIWQLPLPRYTAATLPVPTSRYCSTPSSPC